MCTETISIVLSEKVGCSCDQRFSLPLEVVIRYFSDTKQMIVSTFLELAESEGGVARSIVCAVVGFLFFFEKCYLKKEKLGTGTDNACVMTGINNGAHKVQKEEYDLKDLVLIR